MGLNSSQWGHELPEDSVYCVHICEWCVCVCVFIRTLSLLHGCGWWFIPPDPHRRPPALLLTTEKCHYRMMMNNRINHVVTPSLILNLINTAEGHLTILMRSHLAFQHSYSEWLHHICVQIKNFKNNLSLRTKRMMKEIPPFWGENNRQSMWSVIEIEMSCAERVFCRPVVCSHNVKLVFIHHNAFSSDRMRVLLQFVDHFPPFTPKHASVSEKTAARAICRWRHADSRRTTVFSFSSS